MNKRKIRKQIKLGNTYMPDYVGSGRANFVTNMSKSNQLLMFDEGVEKPKVNKPQQLKRKKRGNHNDK